MSYDRAASNAHRAAQLDEEQRAMSREAWRDGFLTCLRLIGCAMLGMFLFGCAFHTTDYQLSMVYFWSALVLGYSGMAASLLGYYKRGAERGQW
jgi:hypothetical protein